MAKSKITKKELPFLKRDLNIDKDVLERLSTTQKEYKTKFKDRIASTNKEAVKRYSTKIESLTKAKAEMIKEFTSEIKKYQALVKNLKGTTAYKTPSKRRPTKKPK